VNSTVLFKTKSENSYFYDFKINQSLFCHPALHYLIKLHSDGVNLKNWVKNLKGKQIENYGFFTKREIQYYYKKFLLLQKNGYFSTIDKKHRLGANLSAKTVESTLANLRQITFEVTDACNLRCAYCGYGKFYENYDKRKNKNLATESAKTLLRYFLKLWNSPLNISHQKNIYISFYGGEPLLNMSFIKDIVEFVKKSKVLHNQFTFTITTNAILLEKNMDFLVKNNFNMLISLDGNEKNNNYRVFKNGSPAYKHIVKNITALKKKYPAYFKKKVNFNAVLHNKNSVAQIYSYFKKHFNKIARIGELNTSGIKESQKQAFLKTYQNINESLHQSEDYSTIEKDMFLNLPTPKSIMMFIHFYSGNVHQDYKHFLYSSEDKQRTPTGTCAPFGKRMFVTVNGKLLPCERIGQQHALGSLDEKGVSIDCEKITKLYNGYYDKLRKLCTSCFNSETCQQCIFNLNITDERPKCLGFMNYEDFSQFLSSHLTYLEKQPEIYSRIMKEAIVE